jgi:hypothetical protein
MNSVASKPMSRHCRTSRRATRSTPPGSKLWRKVRTRKGRIFCYGSSELLPFSGNVEIPRTKSADDVTLPLLTKRTSAVDQLVVATSAGPVKLSRRCQITACLWTLARGQGRMLTARSAAARGDCTRHYGLCDFADSLMIGSTTSTRKVPGTALGRLAVSLGP